MAGRDTEQQEFERLLGQSTILENLVLTGLRGVGKTVLLDTFKPLALAYGWHWVGADLSEAVSVSEDALTTRLLADLSVVSSSVTVGEQPGLGFAQHAEPVTLNYETLGGVYERTPGLVADRRKAVLELVADATAGDNRHGIVLAYDEAQNLADSPAENQFPLSLLLDVFQSIQRKGIPFLLVLTGLPTLFPKLVEARTFAERMFRVLPLDRLDDQASREAILRPIESADCPVRFDDQSIDTICAESSGYPYFIQFICREVFDAFIQSYADDGHVAPVPLDAITRKLDSDFFAGRWARAADRQRQLLWVIAHLDTADGEFTVQEIVDESKTRLSKPFSNSHANQMLSTMAVIGLVYRNRWGRYSFAVPLFNRFIQRQGDPGVPTPA